MMSFYLGQLHSWARRNGGRPVGLCDSSRPRRVPSGVALLWPSRVMHPGCCRFPDGMLHSFKLLMQSTSGAILREVPSNSQVQHEGLRKILLCLRGRVRRDVARGVELVRLFPWTGRISVSVR